MNFPVDKLVLTPDDVDLGRSPLAGHLGVETYCLGAFNPALTRLPNGNLLMMVRVAEALRTPIVDGKVHNIRWCDGRYLLDAWPLELANTADPRKFTLHGGGWKIMALTSLAWLLPVELTPDGLNELVGKLPAGGAMSLPGQPPHLFYIGRQLPRTELLGLTPEETVEWVRERLSELVPIYRFIAWSRDNDFVSMRQVLDKEKTVKRQKGLHKGDKVRVVRGMFTGKDGLVQEVDAKGQLKVLVGKMVVKLDAADVERPA